ncbi:extracellular solute-binding protein [Propionibacteriaceae bacterium Y2011]
MSRNPITSPGLSRRALLAGAAGVAGAIGLAACDSGGGGTGSGEPGGNAEQAGKVPTFVPYADVTPDLPGTAEGVAPVFYNFPSPPSERPGFPLPGGEPFTALMQSLPPEMPPEQNENYKKFAEDIGTTFEVIPGTYVNYTEKFQVTMAGGDIPDLVQLIAVPEYPKLLETYFTDLTDILGGDGVKDYPGLANIPTPTWKISTINGRIWGIAQPRPPAGVTVNYRGDIFEERGVDPNVTVANGEEYIELLKSLTNKDKNEFAMGADPVGWLLRTTQTMCGTPNGWKEEGGVFTHEYETEEYEMALTKAAEIIAAGCLHPNSFSDTASNSAWYKSGVSAMYVQSFVGWGGNERSNPEWKSGNLELPKWDGGGMAPIRKSVAGYYAPIGIKKTDDDARVEQLLRIADYIASPFGTSQYLQVNYGNEGYSWEYEGPNPKKITDSPAIVPLTYNGGNSGAILFGQGVEESVQKQHDYLSRAIPAGKDDASEGLYSETFNSEGAKLTSASKDVMRGVLQGTMGMDAWRGFVKEWQDKVGNKSREEYAEALAASQ